MNGLLKNNFYGVFENIRLFLVFTVILSIILFITGNPVLLNVLTLIVPPALGLLSVSCLRKESSSKWYKYKLTLPITRKAIIKSQFIIHIFWTLLGVILVTIVVALTVLIHDNQYFAYGIRDAITLVLCGNVVAILLGAISYPMLYLWGAERTESILAISVIASIGIIFILTLLINLLFGPSKVSDFEYYMSIVIIFIITMVVFTISYFLTTSIFSKNEY